MTWDFDCFRICCELSALYCPSPQNVYELIVLLQQSEIVALRVANFCRLVNALDVFYVPCFVLLISTSIVASGAVRSNFNRVDPLAFFRPLIFPPSHQPVHQHLLGRTPHGLMLADFSRKADEWRGHGFMWIRGHSQKYIHCNEAYWTFARGKYCDILE